jgi:hypothetical protein
LAILHPADASSPFFENNISQSGDTIPVNLQRHFLEVGRSLGKDNVSAEYHPYRELRHSWCCAGGNLEFKVSDYLEGSPDAVLESLAWYLQCMALRKKCPEGKADRYLKYALSSELWVRNKDLYISRARSLSLDPRGEVRNLDTIFQYVNSFYFGNRLPYPSLAWSTESPRTRLGFYFAPLNLLAVNRVLDSERVPRYVLEFVVYHELLHHVNAGGSLTARRVHHTRSFREQEMAFSHYEDAERWLRKLVRERRSR